MNSYTEYPVISDQIMIAFTRIEHLMAFIESGPMTVGIAPRPYHFDPPSDPFGVGDSVCWDGSAPHSDKEQQLVYVGDSNFTINNAVEVF